MNIYEKMLLIASELNNVEKTTELDVGKGGKKPVFGEQDVLGAVKPLLLKYKVYGYPYARRIIDSGTLAQGERSVNFMRVDTTYRFVNVEKPEEYVEVTSYGDGLDSGDKAPGKALTYSDKYALMKAFQIVTGDDPDQETPEPTPYRPYNRPQGAFPQGAGQQPQTEPKPASQKQKELIAKLLLETGADISEFGVASVDSITIKQASDILDDLFKRPKLQKDEPKFKDDLPF